MLHQIDHSLFLSASQHRPFSSLSLAHSTESYLAFLVSVHMFHTFLLIPGVPREAHWSGGQYEQSDVRRNCHIQVEYIRAFTTNVTWSCENSSSAYFISLKVVSSKIYGGSKVRLIVRYCPETVALGSILLFYFAVFFLIFCYCFLQLLGFGLSECSIECWLRHPEWKTNFPYPFFVVFWLVYRFGIKLANCDLHTT